MMHDFPVLLHGDHKKDCESENSYYDHDTITCKTCPDGSTIKMSGDAHRDDCRCNKGYKMNNDKCESCGQLPSNAYWVDSTTDWVSDKPCQWSCDSNSKKKGDRCVKELSPQEAVDKCNADSTCAKNKEILEKCYQDVLNKGDACGEHAYLSTYPQNTLEDDLHLCNVAPPLAKNIESYFSDFDYEKFVVEDAKKSTGFDKEMKKCHENRQAAINQCYENSSDLACETPALALFPSTE